ncbi:DUF4215 domain-containing protein [Leptospira biflexa]|uniref:myxococcus cysteine-rich repeat containing protein n=1 Tax=Leptospira biflexa TaxID=172 RepID=UPI0010913E38|nr:DUF4215 domain-containing protein [Leptospira biflexa]
MQNHFTWLLQIISSHEGIVRILSTKFRTIVVNKTISPNVTCLTTNHITRITSEPCSRGITNKASGTIGTSNITDVTADCNICGNGVKLSYEACDDGNLVNGDGCNNTCRIESGFSCNNSSPSVCTSI